ncbi:SGNH/GDSL hydrolase family protein [Algirhabdus cladophorae]|uniref:SGNH/GDSL hydrolase family protein n=1 Tax=Algirhabdus cladophorae TaxID=3377108 RepID=UPI003B84B236
MPRLLSLVSLMLFALAQPAVPQAQPRILVMGDSMMASHTLSGRAIPHVLAKRLKTPVSSRAVTGARIIYNLPITGAMGLSIPQQFRPGEWDWVVLNGGGNDLWLGCGCHKCDRKMDRLISDSGLKGQIPSLVAKIRKTGAKVLYVGYLRSPGANSPIESCKDDGDILEQRISTLARKIKGVYFLSNKDLVPEGDRSYHGLDMIHPSIKGSNAIGTRIARFIADTD